MVETQQTPPTGSVNTVYANQKNPQEQSILLENKKYHFKLTTLSFGIILAFCSVFVFYIFTYNSSSSSLEKRTTSNDNIILDIESQNNAISSNPETITSNNRNTKLGQELLKDNFLPNSQNVVTDNSNYEIISKQGQLYYKNEDEIWLLDQYLNSKKISNTNKGLFSFAQTPDAQTVVFISGEKKLGANNTSYIVPNTVALYSLKSDKTIKIFELQPESFTNSEYTLSIKDVGISNDGKKVAITTSDSLYIYDADTANLSQIFSFPIPSDNLEKRGIVYSYSHPIFSPDKSKILLYKNYYETSSPVIAFLETKVIHEIPKLDWVSIVGWLDDESVILNQYRLGSLDEGNTIQKVTIMDDQVETILTIPINVYDAVLHQDKMYVVGMFHKANSTIYPDTGTTYYENYSTLHEIDLTSKSAKELNTIKQEVIIPNAVSKIYERILLSFDKQTLFVSGKSGINNNPPYSPKYTQTIFSFNLETKNIPKEIVNDASF